MFSARWSALTGGLGSLVGASFSKGRDEFWPRASDTASCSEYSDAPGRSCSDRASIPSFASLKPRGVAQHVHAP